MSRRFFRSMSWCKAKLRMFYSKWSISNNQRSSFQSGFRGVWIQQQSKIWTSYKSRLRWQRRRYPYCSSARRRFVWDSKQRTNLDYRRKHSSNNTYGNNSRKRVIVLFHTRKTTPHKALFFNVKKGDSRWSSSRTPFRGGNDKVRDSREYRKLRQLRFSSALPGGSVMGFRASSTPATLAFTALRRCRESSARRFRQWLLPLQLRSSGSRGDAALPSRQPSHLPASRRHGPG